jgi:GNAT superfamily N-acetyltransferase
MTDGGIRMARASDAATLQDIERAAGRAFADLGMLEVAADDPPPIETLLEYQRAGRCWVWADGSDRPVAYLVSAIVDGNAHLEQVSVHPDHSGRGIGRALIDHFLTLAREQGMPAATLTTFRDVPWNGPYYHRIGFQTLPESALTEGLRTIRASEAARGLDRWPRVCMRLPL